MFHNFPHQGKIITIIMLISITCFIYTGWSKSPFNESNYLKPGTKKYKVIHGNSVDTIPKDSIEKWNREAT